MKKTHKKNKTSIVRLEMPGIKLYQDADDKMLYVQDLNGHVRKVTMPQWEDMIFAGSICGCNQCLSCSIYMATLSLIKQGEQERRAYDKTDHASTSNHGD